eukprot:6234284-Amphidinium_carterae.1
MNPVNCDDPSKLGEQHHIVGLETTNIVSVVLVQTRPCTAGSQGEGFLNAAFTHPSCEPPKTHCDQAEVKMIVPSEPQC